MISVERVSRVYGKGQNQFTALDDVSFVVPEGCSAAIVGKSGSGKSTLLHLLGGLDHPTSGVIKINGQDITHLKRKGLDNFRAQQLGFVFQSFFVEARQTCYQNVALPLEINNVPLRRRQALVQEALAAVDLADKVNAYAGNLSGGQKQRLAIARAIINKPQLILADEPTGNLDSATGTLVMDLLFNLHKNEGANLIIVTHDHELAARCDLQISIKDGKIQAITGDKPARPAETKRPRRVVL